jgi:hypothetical protein
VVDFKPQLLYCSVGIIAGLDAVEKGNLFSLPGIKPWLLSL